MATPYGEIYNAFLSQVPDERIMSLDDESREEVLLGYLNMAQARFQQICKAQNFNLSNRDDVAQEYADDLPLEAITVLALGMVWARAEYRLNHSDNLSNYLNSKDLSLAGSPGKFLGELRAYAERAKRIFISEANLYSHAFSEIESLTPNGVRG